MTLPQSIISGAVQGITEFFPISSSGHLVILHSFFGLKEPQLAFDIFLHFGTLVSIVIFFRRDVASLLGKKRKAILPILIASFPTFVIAFIFRDAVERLFDMPKIVGYMLMITGIWIMAAVIYYRIKGKQRNVAEPGIMRALAVGIAQGIAIVPGISRSGATIATGMLSGMRREEAFKFSFLLAIPAIAGACIFKARKIQLCLAASETACFSAGAVTAMIAGIISLKVLSKAVRGDKLYLFGIYCFFAGIVTIILS